MTIRLVSTTPGPPGIRSSIQAVKTSLAASICASLGHISDTLSLTTVTGLKNHSKNYEHKSKL